MPKIQHDPFDPALYLANAGLGRRIVKIDANDKFFAQGDQSDALFYLQTGRAKLTVVSQMGKEATITMLSVGDFVGEEAIVPMVGLRLSSAVAITVCTALRIDRAEMVRAMQEQHSISDVFMAFLLKRSMRVQADLVDHLFNSSEKRLARILLLMADFGKPGEPELLLPRISQESLAEMVGTTRSRVSFFMNRFRQLGLIEYNGRIRIRHSLLNVVLHDGLTQENAESASIISPSQSEKEVLKRRRVGVRLRHHDA